MSNPFNECSPTRHCHATRVRAKVDAARCNALIYSNSSIELASGKLRITNYFIQYLKRGVICLAPAAVSPTISE